MALLVAAPAQAQVKFGVKAGLNLSKVSTSGAIGDNLKNDNRAGYFIGPMLDVKVPLIGLGIDGALMYNQRNGKVGAAYAGVETSEDLTQHSIAIPVNDFLNSPYDTVFIPSDGSAITAPFLLNPHSTRK